MSEEEKNELLIDDNSETKKTEKKSVKEKKEEKKEVKKAIPKLFFKENDKIEISVDGYHSNETGELQYVILTEDNKDEDESLKDIFTKVTYKFWFSRCPYNQFNRYRTRSIIYNSQDQNNTINQIRLREFFLIFHLVDWNLTDEQGKKVELKFDPNRALSDESLKMIYTLPSMLIDTVLASYERKMMV